MKFVSTTWAFGWMRLAGAGGCDGPATPQAEDPHAGHQHPHEAASQADGGAPASTSDAHAHAEDAHHAHAEDAHGHAQDAHAHGDHHPDEEVNGHAHHEPRPSTPLIPDGGVAAAISFSNLHQQVLVPSCATSSCHGKAFSAYLNLTDKNGAHASLVEQEALGEPCFGKGRVRVVPGAPDSSLLVQKLEGTACGARMPKDGVHLPPAQVELIRAWIYAGAKND